MIIRSATIEDAGPIQAIYAPVVAKTAISFEEVIPDVGEIAKRISVTLASYPYLVAEVDDRLLGFAYASQHRTRSAFRTSIDVTVYVANHSYRRGVGRELYAALLPAAAERGFHAAFAAIALPNAASVGLHESFGFSLLGIYREVGRKFDRWHDVGWWQRLL